MPKLQIIKPPYRNVDPIVTPDGCGEMLNGTIDEFQGWNRRPGLWQWWRGPIPDGYDGLYWWADKGLLIGVAGGRIWSFADLTSMPVELTTPEVRLVDNQRVSFATNGGWLFMANGTFIVAWNGTDPLQVLRTRPKATKVVHLNGKFLANEVGSRLLYWTEYQTAEATAMPTWTTGFFAPETITDNLTALETALGEIVIAGPRNTEFWLDAGNEDVPFARVASAPCDRGVYAPNSIVFADNTWFWLDHERRVVRLEGHTPKVISMPLDRVFKRISNAKDCFGFFVDKWVGFSFASDQSTYLYNIQTQQWEDRWTYYNSITDQHERWLGQYATYVPEWGYWVVAGRKNSCIYLCSDEFATDALEEIRCVFRSSHIDHDTHHRKRSTRLTFHLRRGQNTEV
jgi:hypothetical protein